MAKSDKYIRAAIIKQIKEKYTNFNQLKAKDKKEILNDLWPLMQNSNIQLSEEEILGIHKLPDNIITLRDMKLRMLENKKWRHYMNPKINAINDDELRFLEELIDWRLINQLLVNKKYTPGKRDIHPVQFFKAELLKQLKYPEISYRKYDEREINNPERKENRAFLLLRGCQRITHDQLSKFRASLDYRSLLNVLVYFIALFLDSKDLKEACFHGVDSTELAVKLKPYPLFKATVGGEKIRFYSDIDCDLGRRRNKRDKSRYILGYRMHTLTVIDPQSGQAYPLISLLAAANHHDSNFLETLLKLAQAIGLDVKLVVADQAYGSEQEYDVFYNTYGARLLNNPKEIVRAPQYVDRDNGQVRKNSLCEFPMKYMGRDIQKGHEFHCNANDYQCPFENSCDKIRFIKMDSGLFGLLPVHHIKQAGKALQMRKVIERPFNLIKHRDGLEPLRTKGMVNSTFAAVTSNITTLVIELAGFRKKMKKKEKAESRKKVA